MGSSSLNLGEVSDLVHHAADVCQEPQPVRPERLVIDINGHFLKKFINWTAQARHRGHSFVEILVSQGRRDSRAYFHEHFG
jgi:hypothetical protein